MKREEVLAILDELIDVPVIECMEDQEFVDGAKRVRAFIAQALDDAERYRWLRDQSQDDVSIRVESSMRSGRRSYYKVAGPGVDGLIDTARSAAAGGEELT